jgi:hypothetical protein
MNPIPWYKSNVLRSLVAALVTFGARKLGLGELAGADVAPIVDGTLELLATLFVVLAGVSRIVQPTPPLTMTKSSAEDAAQPPKSSLFAAMFALLIMLPILHGCATFAVGRAETPEQKAAALLGDFTIYQKASLQVGNDQAVVPEVRKAVLDAAIAAKPVADSLDTALRDYRLIGRQVQAGETGKEKLIIATANLQSWIRQLGPLVTQLRSLVDGVPHK